MPKICQVSVYQVPSLISGVSFAFSDSSKIHEFPNIPDKINYSIYRLEEYLIEHYIR